ncbi:hypothetical protein U1Q18_011534 [Sarracenia purpurea var. burkii]
MYVCINFTGSLIKPWKFCHHWFSKEPPPVQVVSSPLMMSGAVFRSGRVSGGKARRGGLVVANSGCHGRLNFLHGFILCFLVHCEIFFECALTLFFFLKLM